MDNYMEVRSIEEVAYLLNILFANLNNLDRTYYDMFINPEPMDIELQRYDETGTLTTVILPNRAKDRILTYAGSGNPNGNQVATVGALYIDTSSRTLYYKSYGSDAYGWVIIWSASNLVSGVDFLSPTGNGSQITDLNASNVTSGILSVLRGGTGANSVVGMVKGNGMNPFTAAVDGVDYLGPSSSTGIIVFYPVSTIPNGWLFCDGAAYSRTTYSRLFGIIGTTYGAGDGETTFNIPDLRDYFIRGWNGTREFNQIEEGNIGAHTHHLSGTTGPGSAHSHTRGTMEITGSFRYGATNGGTASGAFYLEGDAHVGDGDGDTSKYNPYVNFTASRTWTGSTSSEDSHTHDLTGVTTDSAGMGENLVINKAAVPIIKY